MNYSNPAAFSNAQLKRNRPPEEPPLPKVSIDIVLQVFTHQSLRRHQGNPEEYGDNERFIQLGQLALDVTVTHILFNQRPLLSTQEIISEREAALSDANLNKWVTMYQLRQKLRCHPDILPSLDSPEETRSLFCAYVGGVYAENGIETVQEWMSHLLIGEETPSSGSRWLEPNPQPAEPPPKKARSELLPPYSVPTPYQSAPIFFGSQPPPSPPMDRQRQLPPHMHAMPPPIPLPNPLAPARPSLPFLPLFNQTAAQRRLVVDYPAEFSGPPHAGQWNVRCLVNGIPKGMGSGPSKQIAKEEAARQAYYAMGWT